MVCEYCGTLKYSTRVRTFLERDCGSRAQRHDTAETTWPTLPQRLSNTQTTRPSADLAARYFKRRTLSMHQ